MASDPKRLLVAGDVHGDAAWFDALCGRAAEHVPPSTSKTSLASSSDAARLPPRKSLVR